MPSSSLILTLRAASTGPVVLSGTGSTNTLDGVELSPQEYVLIKNQGVPTQNGIYAFGGGPGPTYTYSRVTAYDPNLMGSSVIIVSGAANANTQWFCYSDEVSTGQEYAFGLIPGYVSEVAPRGLSLRDEASCTRAIQDAINDLVTYEDHKYTNVKRITSTSTYYFSSSDHACLLRFEVDVPVTIRFDNTSGLDPGFFAVVALMGKGKLRLRTDSSDPRLENDVYTGEDIEKRFQAAKVTVKTPGTLFKWRTEDALVTRGGTLYFPGGEYLIDGDGLKLHPSISIRGEGTASAVLKADPELVGAADDVLEDPALLIICARAYEPDTSNAEEPEAVVATQFFQPLIQNISIRGHKALENNVSGCVLEPGGQDPFFPPGGNSKDYKGSSANFINVDVVAFTNYGVLVCGERQRFYCEGLRCLGNGHYDEQNDKYPAGGLRILGNDPVIGPRSGFGGNLGTSVQLSGCSGPIVTGVNIWGAGPDRHAPDSLAIALTNVSGGVISACKISDTLLIQSGKNHPENPSTAITVTGNYFNADEASFEGTDPHGSTPGDPFDTFIHVSGLNNVHIAANTFQARSKSDFDDDHVLQTYGYLLVAATEANVEYPDGEGTVTRDLPANVCFTGEIKSKGTYTKSHRISPILVVPSGTDDPSGITYSLRDISTGASLSGRTGYSTVHPSMRGLDSDDIGNADYEGYSAVDAGPILQFTQPELVDDTAVKFYHFATAGTLDVPVGIGHLFLSKAASNMVIVVNFQVPTTRLVADIPIEVVFRSNFGGSSFNTFTWKSNSVPLTLASGDTPLPTTITASTVIRLMYRGSEGVFYRRG